MKVYQKIFIACLTLCSLFFSGITTVKADEIFTSSAKSTYLIDADSGTVIFKQNEEKRLPIASMTKIMLLDIVFDNLESGNLTLDKKITVSKNACGMGGSQVFLQEGGTYLVGDLIKSVAIASANDASVALAEEIAGSETAFVDLMNETAKKMGLKDTLFSNCTGLPKPTQYSSAKDVSAMLRSLLRHKDYYRYSNIWLDKLVHPDGSETTLTNTNKLSKFYQGCDGGKTGFTNESGFCLAATAKRGDMRLIGVVIGEESSKKRFKEVSEMFNRAFSLYESTLIVDSVKPCQDKAKIKGSKQEYVNVYPKNNLTVFTKKNSKVDCSVETVIFSDLKAPLNKGDKVGEITLYKDGVEYAKTDLILNENVNRLNFSEAFDKVAENW